MIIGCPRSGTTLLAHLLSLNTDVFISPETHFFQYIWSQRHLLGLLPARYRTDKIIRCLVASGYPQEENIFPKYRARFRQIIMETQDIRQAFLSIIESLSSRPIIGEKSPWHTIFIMNLLKTYKNIRVLAISRDSPAVVASLFQRDNFRRVDTIIQCSARWLLLNREILKLQNQMPKQQFMHVHFEDLISNPIHTLKTISHWLDIEYSDQMLFPKHQDSSLRSNRSNIPYLPSGILPYPSTLLF